MLHLQAILPVFTSQIGLQTQTRKIRLAMGPSHYYLRNQTFTSHSFCVHLIISQCNSVANDELFSCDTATPIIWQGGVAPYTLL